MIIYLKNTHYITTTTEPEPNGKKTAPPEKEKSKFIEMIVAECKKQKCDNVLDKVFESYLKKKNSVDVCSEDYEDEDVMTKKLTNMIELNYDPKKIYDILMACLKYLDDNIDLGGRYDNYEYEDNMSSYLSTLDEFLVYTLYKMKKTDYKKVKDKVADLIGSLEETMCDHDLEIFSHTNLYLDEDEIDDDIVNKFTKK
jgi:hypothetical protein